MDEGIAEQDDFRACGAVAPGRPQAVGPGREVRHAPLAGVVDQVVDQIGLENPAQARVANEKLLLHCRATRILDQRRRRPFRVQRYCDDQTIVLERQKPGGECGAEEDFADFVGWHTGRSVTVPENRVGAASGANGSASAALVAGLETASGCVGRQSG